MQGRIIQRVTDELVSNNIINSEDSELYTYGLRQGALMFLNILTILFVGRMLGMLWQSVVFMVTYIPLRTYAGGYHARTQWGCYISSVVLIIAVLLGIRFIPWTNFIVITICIISGLIIYILSPVADINKPLDAVEEKEYGKKARLVLALEFSVLILLMFIGVNNIVVCLSVSLLMASFMVVLGGIKNLKRCYVLNK